MTFLKNLFSSSELCWNSKTEQILWNNDTRKRAKPNNKSLIQNLKSAKYNVVPIYFLYFLGFLSLFSIPRFIILLRAHSCAIVSVELFSFSVELFSFFCFLQPFHSVYYIESHPFSWFNINIGPKNLFAVEFRLYGMSFSRYCSETKFGQDSEGH